MTPSEIKLYKSTVNNNFAMLYKAGGTSKFVTVVGMTAVFLAATLVWSASGGYVRGYIGAAQQGADQVPGTWGGTISVALIGASLTTPTNVWSGNIQHVPLRNKALTAAQIAYLSKV